MLTGCLAEKRKALAAQARLLVLARNHRARRLVVAARQVPRRLEGAQQAVARLKALQVERHHVQQLRHDQAGHHQQVLVLAELLQRLQVHRVQVKHQVSQQQAGDLLQALELLIQVVQQAKGLLQLQKKRRQVFLAVWARR